MLSHRQPRAVRPRALVPEPRKSAAADLPRACHRAVTISGMLLAVSLLILLNTLVTVAPQTSTPAVDVFPPTPPPSAPLTTSKPGRSVWEPPIRRIEYFAARANNVNIGLATEEDKPLAMLGVINSTISHCSRPSSLHFHLIVPQHARRKLRQQLQSLFTQVAFRAYSLELNGVRSKIVRHLRRREREPVFVSPYRYAVAYLPSLLPSVRRILWLHTDVLLLEDVIPLYSTDLDGTPAAAVDACEPPLQQARKQALRRHACGLARHPPTHHKQYSLGCCVPCPLFASHLIRPDPKTTELSPMRSHPVHRCHPIDAILLMPSYRPDPSLRNPL